MPPEDMLSFALDKRPPATVILVSGDGDFKRPLSLLAQRRYNIIVIHPTKYDFHLRNVASKSYRWQDLVGVAETSETETEVANEDKPISAPLSRLQAEKVIISFPVEAFESLIRLLRTWLSSTGDRYMNSNKLAALLALYDPSTELYVARGRKAYFERAEQLGIIESKVPSNHPNPAFSEITLRRDYAIGYPWISTIPTVDNTNKPHSGQPTKSTVEPDNGHSAAELAAPLHDSPAEPLTPTDTEPFSDSKVENPPSPVSSPVAE